MSMAVDLLSEFLEVLLHCALFERGLYPSGVFERQKKYGVPVHVCIHPEVREYIQSVIHSLRPHLLSITQVDLVIRSCDPGWSVLEKIVLRLDGVKEDFIENDPYLQRAEEHFRAMILRLSLCHAAVTRLPENCTWEVQVHSADHVVMDPNDVFPWIVADGETSASSSRRILPLKSMDTEFLRLQLFIEDRVKE